MLKSLKVALFSVVLGAVALMTVPASAASGNYTHGPCSFTIQVNDYGGTGTGASSSSYSSDSDCNGTRVRLGYKENGTNKLTSYATDLTGAVYSAGVSRQGSAITPRYADGCALKDGSSTWACAVLWY